MKRFIAATLALSLLAGTAASAQPYGDRHGERRDNDRYEQRGDYDRHDNRVEHRDRGHHYGQRKHWARGERLPSSYYQSRAYYVDYRVYHLRAPPRGYRWVRVDNDYMLVALTSGLIASIIAGR